MRYVQYVQTAEIRDTRYEISEMFEARRSKGGGAKKIENISSQLISS